MDLNLVELNLETIRDLQDGAIFQQVQKLIASAVADCEARPGEERSRKINIQLELKPVAAVRDLDDKHSVRVLDGVKLYIHMDLKCPTRKSAEIDCGVGEGHALLFNPESIYNHRQALLPGTIDGVASVPMAGRA